MRNFCSGYFSKANTLLAGQVLECLLLMRNKIIDVTQSYRVLFHIICICEIGLSDLHLQLISVLECSKVYNICFFLPIRTHYPTDCFLIHLFIIFPWVIFLVSIYIVLLFYIDVRFLHLPLHLLPVKALLVFHQRVQDLSLVVLVN